MNEPICSWCKAHNHAHPMVKCPGCSHEYCDHLWHRCPRCEYHAEEADERTRMIGRWINGQPPK